ncbi:MAG: hypothetical protein H6811_12255 [Phycisphaeraceae bacterium]|nr:hypothetical protein [Phycisphaeraceae bacterium]
MTTVTRPIHFAIEGKRKRAVAGPPPEPAPEGRVPRVSRLMALAIRFDRLLRDGVVPNQSELARLVHVTQPRMTQILNLLHLAPDIQEEILFLPPTTDGRDPIHEHMLREVVACTCWTDQRRRWALIAPWNNPGT